MWNSVARLLTDPSGFTPHGFCLLWDPTLIWTYAVSDIGIGIAYFTIPLALAIFVQQRRDLVFRPILLAVRRLHSALRRIALAGCADPLGASLRFGGSYPCGM